jgi:hypothetical protein
MAALLFWANALVFDSLAIFALALLVQLSVAVVSFYSLVSAASDQPRQNRRIPGVHGRIRAKYAVDSQTHHRTR